MTARRAAATLLVVLAGCTTTARQHPEFAARRARITTVAVMPPEVAFVRRVFKGDDEPLLAETDATRASLPDLLGAELRRRGFTIKPALLDEAHFAADPELRYQTTVIQSRFATAGGQLRPAAALTRADAARVRVSLGSDVNRFADHAEVDALVFSQVAGWKKSGGEVAKDLAMTLLLLGNVHYYLQAGGLQVALVDGTTGEVLWANATFVTDRDFTGGALAGLVRRVFAGYPH